LAYVSPQKFVNASDAGATGLFVAISKHFLLSLSRLCKNFDFLPATAAKVHVCFSVLCHLLNSPLGGREKT
jgi:hypothetical protein